jgi:hypothetical protein
MERVLGEGAELLVTFGAITIRPPFLLVCPATGSLTGKSARLVWVSGSVLVLLYE